tara:strand:+ start:138 stop:539 length:402 start_codon:yes stop_codon:yes gene_type:complete
VPVTKELAPLIPTIGPAGLIGEAFAEVKLTAPIAPASVSDPVMMSPELIHEPVGRWEDPKTPSISPMSVKYAGLDPANDPVRVDAFRVIVSWSVVKVSMLNVIWARAIGAVAAMSAEKTTRIPANLGRVDFIG